MVANNIPNYTQQMVQPPRYSTPPTTAAVNIQIIEPKAYASAPAYPQNDIYNYPPANAYPTPYLPQGCPVCAPQVSAPMIQQAPQSPVQTPAPVIQQAPQAPVQIPAPVVQQAPQAPVQAPPSVIDAAPAPVVVPPQTVETPVAPVPVVQPAVAAPVAEVKEAPKAEAGIDVAGLSNALKSANLDEQTAAIQKIAELGQSNPAQSQALLNEETFKGLADIITKDNSALSTTKDAQTQMSDFDKAEMNRQYGTYTLAVLQKNLRGQIDGMAKQQNVPTIAINDLPGIAPIINNLKGDKSPVVREASISALGYLARPEDKAILTTVFDIAAKQDADANVRKAAQDAIGTLPG